MPTSHPYQINELTKLIMLVDPKSLLDIGVGFGKYGFLSREYLELWNGKEKYGDWKRQIDGIEAFKEYITPVQNYVYNHIYIGNAIEVLPTLKTHYDLILLIDVLEHFDYDGGIKLLEECQKNARNIVVSTPRKMEPQPAFFENEFEKHRFQWQKKHFCNFPNALFIPNFESIIVFMGVDKRVRMKIKKDFRSFLPSHISVLLRSIVMR
jgi:hypothetical protein